jgi:hypothetical protein
MAAQRTAGTVVAAGLVAALFGLGATLLPSTAAAVCSAQELAAARSAIEAACGCPTPGGHGAYVQCAKGAVAPKACRGPAVKCAAKSTCGTARVRCCQTTAKGKTKCSIRSSAAKCQAPKGGSAIAGTGSCCDCLAACGNGVVDPGEECDPPGAPRCPDPSSPTGAFLECSPRCTCPLPCGITPDFQCAGGCPPGAFCQPTPDFMNCHCVSPSQPCGETAPVCNGSCPADEHCAAFGMIPFVYCGCIPIGSPQCGSPGVPVCGGACPTGTECNVVFSPPALGGQPFCDCTPPGLCGSSGGECPNGLGCAQLEGSPICAPIPCSGTAAFPVCGGPCGDGGAGECDAIRLEGVFESCLCAESAPCGAGGYQCPAGMVCSSEPASGTAQCEAP